MASVEENGLHRRHMSCDCNVTSDDADNPNPNIKCTRKEVKETCRFIRWVMTTSEQKGKCYAMHTGSLVELLICD